MLHFRRILELFPLCFNFRIVTNFKAHLWRGMGYNVIFNRLAGITNVALLVPPMVRNAHVGTSMFIL